MVTQSTVTRSGFAKTKVSSSICSVSQVSLEVQVLFVELDPLRLGFAVRVYDPDAQRCKVNWLRKCTIVSEILCWRQLWVMQLLIL